MKTAIRILATTVLACAFPSAYVAADPEGGGIKADRALPRVIEPWLANLHGKTLSTIGRITTIRIRSEEEINSATYPSIAQTHQEIFHVIEESVLGDFSTIGVAVGFPAQFSIEYADGTNIISYGSYATITLPGGRRGDVVLLGRQKNPNKAEMATPRKPSD
jgi:hypothetical protein